MNRLVLPLIALSAPAWAEDRALVIGIDDYTALNPPLVLTQAAADAARFAAFLTERAGFTDGQVTVLTDGEASSDAILGVVTDDLLTLTAPGDRIVIYFAGLGTTTLTRDGAVVPALVAADGASALGLIPADLLDELLDLATDREVVLVLDTSLSGLPAPDGALARSLASDAGPAADYSAFGDRALWTAAAPDGLAWESAEGGVMTGFLLEGMAGVADADGNRIVTNGELAAHVAERSAAFCTALPACAGAGLVPAFTGDAAAPAFIPAHLLPQVQPTGPAQTVPLTYEQMLAFVDELFGPVNPAGLRLGIDAPQPMAVGSEVRFTVSAGMTGSLVLLDIDTEGQLSQIFPSALAPSEGGGIVPGQEIAIPAGLSANGLPLRVTVGGPPGRGILIALFTERTAADLAAVLPEGLARGPLPEAGTHLYAIAQSLLSRDADPAATLGWSAVYLPYEVTP